MTIAEVAGKYNVPYSVAYEASYGVEPVATLERDKDFPEDKLFDNLILAYNVKRRRHEYEIALIDYKIKSANRIRGQV